MTAHPPETAHAAQRPTLVLLHGLELASRRWARPAGALAARYRVLAPDLPGFGRALDAGPFSLDAAATAVTSLLDAAGAGAAHVCGVSLGAAVAIALARRTPARVASVVLCDAPFALPRAVRWGRRLAVALASEGALADRAARRVAPGGAELAQAAREETARVGRRAWLAALRAIDAAAESPAELARLAVPTLLLAGTDRGLERSAARAVAASVSGAELRTVPGAASTCDLASPEAFTAAVVDFVDAVEHRRHDDHDHVGCAMCN